MHHGSLCRLCLGGSSGGEIIWLADDLADPLLGKQFRRIQDTVDTFLSPPPRDTQPRAKEQQLPSLAN